MLPKTSGKDAKKAGKAQKNISNSDRKRKHRSYVIHLQSSEASTSGHRHQFKVNEYHEQFC